MRHRERPPVAEQGRSPRYEQGASTAPRPVSSRTATVLWVIQISLLVAFAVSLTARLAAPGAYSLFGSTFPFGVSLTMYGLHDRAHVRPYPSRASKLLSVVLTVTASAWLVVMLVLDARLRASDPLVLGLLGLVSAALFVGAAVACYRRRYFFWRTSDAPRADPPVSRAGR